MKRVSIAAIIVSVCMLAQVDAAAEDIASPDGHIRVGCSLNDAGELTYSVKVSGKVVLEPSPLGLEATCGNWLKNLTIESVSPVQTIDEHYTLAHGKRSGCHYEAARRSFDIKNAQGQLLRVVFQISNDGVVFRYELPACGDGETTSISREATGFDFPTTARAWLMPIDDGLSGWGRMNPCYERLYRVDIPVTSPSPSTEGWAFPALFRVGDDAWVLLSESNVNGSYCASRLTTATDAGLLRIGFPDERENNGKGPATPAVALPLTSPWRVIVVGQQLDTIVDSTLVEDVADPSRVAEVSFVRPGQAAWSWLREQNESTVFDRQKEYVDMAAKVGFEYCLVDAEWDERIGYEKMAELVRYAKQKGVGIWLWYNSNGNWNDASQTPMNKMHEHEVRSREFRILREMGVRGVKVDFFGGDKQATMQLYWDILRDAADAGIMVNFHGATIPRGWERTWPNLMTMEGVRGEENLSGRKDKAAQECEHCCILPFTRNAIGPMDFTPNCLGQSYAPKYNKHRYASRAFELAMTVVYESGVQHYGTTPEDVGPMPTPVVEYLRTLPDTWDDTHLLAGFPGRFVVIARRAGGRWFIAGMNAQDSPEMLNCDLHFLKNTQNGTVIEDAPNGELRARPLEAGPDRPLKLTLPPRGGFVFCTHS